jgi:hypothetical protein
MIKKAILVLLAFVLTTNGFFNVYAEYGSNTEDLIKQEIKSYFNVKYEILGKLKYDDKIENFFNLNNKHAKDFFLKEKNLLDINIEHRKMQISDLRYNKYEIDLLFNSISVNDNTALVELKENTLLYFNCAKGTETTIAGLPHQISMEMINNNWFIVDDKYPDESKELAEEIEKKLPSDMEYSSKLEKVKEEYLKLSRNELEKNKVSALKASREKAITTDSTVFTNSMTSSTFHEYNRPAAVNYGTYYGPRMNSPPWGNYESPSLGGDCTNFVSQCIYAGGIPFDSTGAYTWYWYSDSNRVPSWTGVTYFRDYLKYNNSSSSSNYGVKAEELYYGAVIEGDIIQNVGTHSMFINAYDRHSYAPYQIYEYYICQHSTTTEYRLANYPLSSKAPATRVYITVYGYYS